MTTPSIITPIVVKIKNQYLGPKCLILTHLNFCITYLIYSYFVYKKKLKKPFDPPPHWTGTKKTSRGFRSRTISRQDNSQLLHSTPTWNFWNKGPLTRSISIYVRLSKVIHDNNSIFCRIWLVLRNFGCSAWESIADSEAITRDKRWRHEMFWQIICLKHTATVSLNGP